MADVQIKAVSCPQAADDVYSMVTETANVQTIPVKDKESAAALQHQQQQQHRPLLVGNINCKTQNSCCAPSSTDFTDVDLNEWRSIIFKVYIVI